MINIVVFYYKAQPLLVLDSVCLAGLGNRPLRFNYRDSATVQKHQSIAKGGQADFHVDVSSCGTIVVASTMRNSGRDGKKEAKGEKGREARCTYHSAYVLRLVGACPLLRSNP